MMTVIGYIFFTFFTVAEPGLVGALILSIGAVIMVLSMGSWQALTQVRNVIIGILAVIVLCGLMTLGGVDFRWVHAITGGVTGAIFVGLVIERFTIRPLIGQPIFAVVMVTLAVGLIIRGLTKLIWGTQPQSLPIFSEPHPWIPGELVRIGQPITLATKEAFGADILIDQPRLFAFLIALASFALFWLFLRFTNVGLAMRASSENQPLAESVGIRVRMILAITWGIAAVLAGIAGVLYVGSTDSNAIDPLLEYVALRAFPAVLLGGLESIGGALIGGLIIGLTEEWAKLLFSGDVAENLAPFLVLMIILVLKPEGLFGEKRIDRI
ncbi:branched-chain amino acid ABC transporter permease [Anaerolineales bacterium]